MEMKKKRKGEEGRKDEEEERRMEEERRGEERKGEERRGEERRGEERRGGVKIIPSHLLSCHDKPGTDRRLVLGVALRENSILRISVSLQFHFLACCSSLIFLFSFFPLLPSLPCLLTKDEGEVEAEELEVSADEGRDEEKRKPVPVPAMRHPLEPGNEGLKSNKRPVEGVHGRGQELRQWLL
eukprot:665637-Hanusia_phi.AAC.5